jgi:hypothetical protein
MTLQRVKKIKAEGTEEENRLLDEGKKKVSSIYAQMQNRKKREELITKSIMDAAATTATTTTANDDDNNDIHIENKKKWLIYGDFTKVYDQIPDNSVHLVFSDLPYDDPSIPLYGELARKAYNKVKDGGCMVLYAGHYALPEIFKQFENTGWTYWWTFAMVHGGPTTRMHKQRVHVG